MPEWSVLFRLWGLKNNKLHLVVLAKPKNKLNANLYNIYHWASVYLNDLQPSAIYTVATV